MTSCDLPANVFEAIKRRLKSGSGLRPLGFISMYRLGLWMVERRKEREGERVREKRKRERESACVCVCVSE